MSARIDVFVVAVALGLELLLEEVQRLGVRPARAVRGGVECTITWPQLWRSTCGHASLTRVVVRVARFHADGFHSLEVGLRAVDGGAAAAGAASPLRRRVTRIQLYHSGAVEERVTGACSAGRCRRAGGARARAVRTWRRA